MTTTPRKTSSGTGSGGAKSGTPTPVRLTELLAREGKRGDRSRLTECHAARANDGTLICRPARSGAGQQSDAAPW
jgi:hypothetical protein